MREQQPGSPVDLRYSYYVLILLTIVCVFSFVDRVILAILQEPIKAEFGLSDTQMGALTGLIFAIFYVSMGIPAARYADRGRRTLVLAASILLWSGMTLATGFAWSFVSLAIFRLMIGVGEGGVRPAATSLLSDYFPPERRATAMSVIGLSPSIGAMLGLLAGGWLNHNLGWRPTFVILGGIGLLFAPLVYFTIRERPSTVADTGGPRKVADQYPLGESLGILWRTVPYRAMVMGCSFLSLATYTVYSWGPAFYSRAYGITTAEIGLSLGLITGIAGAAGVLSGGVIADWLGKSNLAWHSRVPAIASLLFVPAALVQYLATDLWVSYAAAVVAIFFLNMPLGPLVSVSQTSIPAGIRTTGAAVLLVVSNIVGQAFGPFLAGMVSDIFQRSAGLGAGEALRYSIVIMVCFNLAAAALFASGTIKIAEAKPE